MAMIMNVRHCVTCGGVVQYEEMEPTVTASAGNRVVERPDPMAVAAYIGWPKPPPAGTGTGRWCGCPKTY